MSITDELRKEVQGFSLYVYAAPQAERLLAIADRIDAEHERELRGTGEDIVRDVRHEWIRLPVDADGVPWHIGDRTESGQTIQAMGLNKHGWHFVGTVNDIDPSIHRHYHEPTVEDVLREFALACEDAGNAGPEVARIAAEYAKRLTLAGKEDA